MSQLDFYRTILSAKWQDRPGRERQIAKAQSTRLRQILQIAKHHTPFHSQRIGNLTVSNLADQLTEIAPTGKEEMAKHFVDTVNQNQIAKLGLTRKDLETLAANPKGDSIWFRNKILISTTSGTTGEVGITLNSRKTWAIQRAAVFSRTCRHSIPLYRFNILRPYRIAYVVIESPWSLSHQAASDSEKANSWLAKIKCLSIGETRKRLIEQLADFRPDFLQSYPNFLESFAREKLAGTEFGFSPQVISSFGDLLLERQRELVITAFPNAKIVDHYGSTECQPIANSCRLGNLHLNSDYCLLEPVDRNDQPVSDGEFSDHCLITNLVNDFQPFIRYRLTDRVRILTESCECGCPFPVVEIRGRTFLQFHVTGNQSEPLTVNGASFLSALYGFSEISSFLISYHQKNQIEVDIQIEGKSDKAKTIAALKSELRELFRVEGCDQSVQFSINIVEDNHQKPVHFKKKLFDVTYKHSPE